MPTSQRVPGGETFTVRTIAVEPTWSAAAQTLEGAFRVGDDLAFRIFGAEGVDVVFAKHLKPNNDLPEQEAGVTNPLGVRPPNSRSGSQTSMASKGEAQLMACPPTQMLIRKKRIMLGRRPKAHRAMVPALDEVTQCRRDGRKRPSGRRPN